MTRNREFKNGESTQITRDNEWDAKRHKPGERTLYTTVFDHKERTTRVYTRDDEVETFYSTKSDAPLVDVGHFMLEVEIDAEIDSKGDPVCSDCNNLNALRKHHRSILEHIQYRLGAGVVTKTYAIENSWTMKWRIPSVRSIGLGREVVKRLLRRGERRSEPKNHWYLIISCSRQLKGSDGCWMRHVASGLHVERK